MSHNVMTSGQDVFCQSCGCSWSVGEEAPAQCLPPTRAAPTAMGAYLVGTMSPGTNPCLVFAHSAEEATGALGKVLGIHQQDLAHLPAPLLDPLCRVRDSCPSFSPRDLATAYETYRRQIADTWPGASAVVNPFKMTNKRKERFDSRRVSQYITDKPLT